jgi:uncharacterized protein YjeT (DUF2065 family)
LLALLAVGVVPPPFPYLPPLLLVEVAFWGVLVLAVEELDPEVLPQAAKRTTSAAAASTPKQERARERVTKRLPCIVFFPFACAENTHDVTLW